MTTYLFAPRRAAREGWRRALGQMVPAWVRASGLLILALSAGAAPAQEAEVMLESLTWSSMPGNRLRIELMMSAPPPAPKSFTVDQPARIALDFAGVRSALDKKRHTIESGAVHSLTAIEGQGRTRVVLNLTRQVSHDIRTEGNKVLLTLEGVSAKAAASEPQSRQDPGRPRAAVEDDQVEDEQRLEAVDFRRGSEDSGLVQIQLSNPSVPIDVRREGNKVIVDFMETTLPEDLERRLDVTDFATPVEMVDTYRKDGLVRMEVTAQTPFEHLAYQTDGDLTLEVKEAAKEADEPMAGEEYTGEKLSLNFQQIDVRAALQVIADFTGLNIVVSDAVQGSLTLRLQAVPWDQAMDIILKSEGLGMRRQGNVILVAPSQELAEQERQELESRKQMSELEPLRSELIQVNYAKAADFAELLKSKDNSLLSERGNVSIDVRTNTLLVRDTAERLQQIREVISKLDIPVRQVLIESRIVIANNDFSKDLGVRFGATGVRENGDNGVVASSGTLQGTDQVVNSALSNMQGGGDPFPVDVPSLNNRLNVNLPAAGSNAGRLGFAILGQDYLLDLELSALQAEGRGEVVSSPRVITANQKEAFIEQGVEIPYQEAASSGATSVSFKKAVLSLKVVPQITPDDRIIMDLQVNKDSVGEVFLGVPSINTREIATQVLVENGETVVLGGIYEQTRSEETNSVPFFGDLPVVGNLFKQSSKVDDKVELLIFVTPKIKKETLGLD